MGFSPNPPPQAARAFVRQLFGGRTGRAPVVTATLLEHADGGSSSALELVDEGGTTENLVCLAETDGRVNQVDVGSLGPGESTAVRIDAPNDGDFLCVWLCSDRKGSQHIWSYDGRHQHTRGTRLTPEAAFRLMYPRGA